MAYSALAMSARLSRARPLSVLEAPGRHTAAGRVLPRAGRGLCHAGSAAGTRRSLDVRNLGAGRRGNCLGGHPPTEGADSPAFGLLLEIGVAWHSYSGCRCGRRTQPWWIFLFANSAFVGAVLVAIAGLFTAWHIAARRQRNIRRRTRASPGSSFAWGLAVVAGSPSGARSTAGCRATSMFRRRRRCCWPRRRSPFAAMQRPLRWPMARFPALLLLPVCWARGRRRGDQRGPARVFDHAFAHGGFAAWPARHRGCRRACFVRFDRSEEAAAEPASGLSLEPWHAGLFWLVLLLGAHELAWVGGHDCRQAHNVWSIGSMGPRPGARALVAVCALASRDDVGRWERTAAATSSWGGAPVARVARVVVVRRERARRRRPGAAALHPAGRIRSILCRRRVFVALADWTLRATAPGSRRIRRVAARRDRRRIRRTRVYLDQCDRAANHSFRLRRPVHAARALAARRWCRRRCRSCGRQSRWRRWRGRTGASGARLGWSAPCCWASSSRNSSLVELAQVGTITRIVSFIGVGLLLLLIGYLAPVPPRKEVTP